MYQTTGGMNPEKNLLRRMEREVDEATGVVVGAWGFQVASLEVRALGKKMVVPARRHERLSRLRARRRLVSHSYRQESVGIGYREEPIRRGAGDNAQSVSDFAVDAVENAESRAVDERDHERSRISQSAAGANRYVSTYR